MFPFAFWTPSFPVDDASLARVENAARNISNQTIDEADHLRAISRRNDLIAIDRANRLMVRFQSMAFRHFVKSRIINRTLVAAPCYTERLR